MASAYDERRQYGRLTTPTLTVHFDGITYETENWSLGGLRIKGYDGFRPRMALVNIAALGLVGEMPVCVDVRALISRIDALDDALSLRYLVIDSKASRLLNRIACGPAPSQGPLQATI